jgi:hypothetical protein
MSPRPPQCLAVPSCLSQAAYKLPAGVSAPVFPSGMCLLNACVMCLASCSLCVMMIGPEHFSSSARLPPVGLPTSSTQSTSAVDPLSLCQQGGVSRQESTRLPLPDSPSSFYHSLVHLVWETLVPGQKPCQLPLQSLSMSCRAMSSPPQTRLFLRHWHTDVGRCPGLC